MSKLSIIIPARNEVFLSQTVNDLLTKAVEDIEIIVVLDGYWPDPPLQEDKRLHIIHRGKPLGLRNAINSAAEIAKGKYILKCDAHCLFGDGYDEILKADCESNWISIPRRYSLDAINWCRKEKHPIDYLYLECPSISKHGDLAGVVWNERNYNVELEKVLIDDLLTFQGSCWFMHKDYFFELGKLDEENYGTFRKEPQELGFKCWLSGGRVIRNKKTWYAHLHKGKQFGRGYSLRTEDWKKGDEYNKKWLTNSAWNRQTKDFKWLIDKFMPMPEWENYEW